MTIKNLIVCLLTASLFISSEYAKAANDPEPSASSAANPVNTTQGQQNETNKEPKSPLDVHLKDPDLPKTSGHQANKEKILQLQLRSSIFSNQGAGNTTTANTSNANTGTTTSTATVFYNDVALQATTPRLGPSTRLSAGIGGSFIRFFDGTGYDMLNTNAGILQELGHNMSAELGGRHRTSYGVGGLNDLTEYTPRFALNRTDRLGWITPDLSLNTNYEFQANFADPVLITNVTTNQPEKINRSRISNFFRLGLGYNFNEKWQGSLSYRLANDNYNVFGCTRNTTNPDCNFTRHEFNTSLTYYFRPHIFASGSVSYINGENLNLLPKDQVTTSQTIDQHLNFITFGLTLGANFSFF